MAMRKTLFLVDYQKLTDDDLVRRAQESDTCAFDELINRHLVFMRRLATSVLRNPADAEDEVQNALILAFIHIREFAYRASFKSWVSSIVLNQTLSCIRRRRRAASISLDLFSNSPLDGNLRCSARHDPEQRFAEKQTHELLSRNLRRLPPMLRQSLTMSVVDNLRTAEIARRLGISLGAAKSRICRARNELSSRIQGHSRLSAMIL